MLTDQTWLIAPRAVGGFFLGRGGIEGVEGGLEGYLRRLRAGGFWGDFFFLGGGRGKKGNEVKRKKRGFEGVCTCRQKLLWRKKKKTGVLGGERKSSGANA